MLAWHVLVQQQQQNRPMCAMIDPQVIQDLSEEQLQALVFTGSSAPLMSDYQQRSRRYLAQAPPQPHCPEEE